MTKVIYTPIQLVSATYNTKSDHMETEVDHHVLSSCSTPQSLQLNACSRSRHFPQNRFRLNEAKLMSTAKLAKEATNMKEYKKVRTT